MWEHSYGEQDYGSHRKRTCWLHWSARRVRKTWACDRCLPFACPIVAMITLGRRP